MMNRDPRCPVCGRPRLVSTLHRSRLPAMQNYVFRSYESAMETERGPFDLAVCGVCGFAWNVAFDSRLLHYDRGYDNNVPSRVMSAYYEEIAVHLHDGYRLADGLIVDVSCGKGTFLKIACEMFLTARGLGIDPSYEGETSLAGGRIRFIRDYFSAEQIR